MADLTGRRFGVAVSGGGDSMALLHLLNAWAKRRDLHLQAVTVDHGLRPESASEAETVASACVKIGLSHTTLKWADWDGAGNLQDQARRARYRLMADWALENDLGCIAIGHTREDQAETFLMRLARGAGVDGLSAMASNWQAHGMHWVRPLLPTARQDLREYLQRHNVAWVEDPSNQDTHYERVKARQAMAALEPLGISAAVLQGVAENMAQAKHALNMQAHMIAEKIVKLEAGSVLFEREGFLAEIPEIQRRLMMHTINFISSADYAPRGRAVLEILDQIAAGQDATLQGCRIVTEKFGFRVFRELKAVEGVRANLNQLWDMRWRMTGPDTPGACVAALGDKGLKSCLNWRDVDLPRAVLLATPAIWKDDKLLAAPVARFANGWVARLEKGEEHYFKSLLSH